MNLRRLVRQLCPPLLYDAWRRPKPAVADPRVIIGKNVLMNARVQNPGQGRLIVGDDAALNGWLYLQSDHAEIRIGNNSFVNSGTVISAVQSVVIEDDVLISFNCTIMDCDGHSIRLSERRDDLRMSRAGSRAIFDKAVTRPIHIRHGAWLGAHCIVLKGVTVGVGAVVAAASVVTRDVPDWTIVAGNPARPIRTIAESDR